MNLTSKPALRLLLSFFCLTLLMNFTDGLVRAQQQRPAPTPDDVLRVNTDLVQTAITVVDKNGRFVDGLDRGQFELTVDGKARPISFFERVTAGSVREGQLAAQQEPGATAEKLPVDSPTIQGRTIIFFIDDLHLSADSMVRTKIMLQHFLDTEMGSRDSVAIASASGQIGFLQQFTRNKEVLSAAMARLSPRQYDVRSYGTGSTKMSEFDALNIDSAKSNNTVLSYYIRECIVQSSLPKTVAVARAAMAASCDTQVRNSARIVLTQAGNITRNTYASLESLMRSSARAPGRKLAFFISDGFLLDTGPRGPDLRTRLDSVIDAAHRAGVVVYTIDARGLITNRVELTQANARLDVGAPVGEIAATQDALNALAEDTGGRALRNQNYFDRWVDKVLDETSNYYVLAWRPSAEEEKTPRFRHVRVNVVGHPELTARAPRGYLEGPQPAAENVAAAPAKSTDNHSVSIPEAELREALSDYYPRNFLLTQLSLTFLNTPKNETVLTSSMQISTLGLTQPATIKLAGLILNDKGKIAAGFKNQVNITTTESGRSETSVIYNHHTALTPGVYQVRVAARDEKSGRVGSAMQWVVIPELGTHQLTLSSLLLGGQVLADTKSQDGGAQIQLSVDHRFSRANNLGYWVFIYNAKRDATGAPSLTVQTQVLRDGRVMLTAPLRKLNQGGPDPDRIPFGEELALKTLAPGLYDLRVTITDGISGTSTIRIIDFEVL
jgi:VWFA-related protein